MGKNNLFKISSSLAAIAVLLLLMGWMAGMFHSKVAPGQVVIEPANNKSVMQVIKREQVRFEPVSASIEARQATLISSRIMARIEKVHVRAGEKVKKGQLLIELEQLDLKSRVSQAKQQSNSVQARLTEASLFLQRAVKLVEQGVLSQSDKDKAQAKHDALLAEHAAARQSLQEAKAALSFAQILSPIDGRVVDRMAEPGDTAQPGSQLLSIYNPFSLRVEAYVREQLVMQLNVAQSLSVLIPANNQKMIAEIEELVPAGEPGSRSFLVKARLPQNQGLLPGMYARLLVPVKKETLLLIPLDRVASVGQLDVVWVSHQGQSQRRFVRLGKRVKNGLVEVISGLAETDQVLPKPMF